VPVLVKRVLKQLAVKSLPTKQAAFALLRELTGVLSGGLETYAPALLVKVTDSLSTAGSPSMTTEALAFLGAFFATHPVAVYASALPTLVERIVQLTQDKQQKVSAEAMSVLAELTRSIRPDPTVALPAELSAVVEQIFVATSALFKGGLADADVRIKAVETLSDIVFFFGDVLGGQMPVALELLGSALSNDSLRLTAVRGVQRVAQSEVVAGAEAESWLGELVKTLPGTLRRGSRTYKADGFRALDAVLLRSVHGSLLVQSLQLTHASYPPISSSRLGESLSATAVPALVTDLQPFITEQDLYNLPLALNVITVLLATQPAAKAVVEAEILPRVYALVRTPLITGLPLEAVLAFFEALIAPDQELALKVIPELLKVVGKEKTLANAAAGEAQATRTTAKCVGVVVKAAPRDRAGVIAEFAKQIEVRAAVSSLRRHRVEP